MAETSRCLRHIGLPTTVRWTHLEATCPESTIGFTLGACFHFRARLDDKSKVVVNALPGLENNALHRCLELPSALEFQRFLLSEVCRQIVLTFGDMAAARTGRTYPARSYFKVHLVPTMIVLLRETPPRRFGATFVGNELDQGRWQVRVCPDRQVRSCFDQVYEVMSRVEAFNARANARKDTQCGQNAYLLLGNQA